MIDDSRIERLHRAFALRPARALPRVGAAEAGVALVLRPRDPLELLFIQRARHERDPWSGQMALPGGRRAPGDPDLLATALRETEEETGLALRPKGSVIGTLDDVRSRGPGLPAIVVAPFVLYAPIAARVRPNSREVAAALWIPLPALTREGAATEISVELEDGPRIFPSVQYGDRVIWGLTHRILVQFLDVARACGL